MKNSEHVQRLRDTAVTNMSVSSEARKQAWDKQAQITEFKKGDRVYLRKLGTNTKLMESWAGPYTVEKSNAGLTWGTGCDSLYMSSY